MQQFIHIIANIFVPYSTTEVQFVQNSLFYRVEKNTFFSSRCKLSFETSMNVLFILFMDNRRVSWTVWSMWKCINLVTCGCLHWSDLMDYFSITDVVLLLLLKNTISRVIYGDQINSNDDLKSSRNISVLIVIQDQPKGRRKIQCFSSSMAVNLSIKSLLHLNYGS